jgi:hypothetical protein
VQLLLRQFAAQCYHYLAAETGQVRGGDESFILIGCPTGWSEGSVKKYDLTLRGAGIPKLKVVRESRAAFIYARDSGRLSEEELRDSVLVIDIGSSTTDITHVGGCRVSDLRDGHDLGASLIDRLLLEHALEVSPDRAELERVLQENPHLKPRWQNECRKAKELFFNSPPKYTGTGKGAPGSAAAGPRLDFRIEITAEVMNGVLQKPTASGRSWPDRFRQLLETARAALEDERKLPRVVLLTGGASRMPFVKEICESVFSKPKTKVYRDKEPQYCVARGLVNLGRWEARCARFLSEIQKLVASPGFTEQFETHLPTLTAALSPLMTTALFDHAVNLWAKALRDGQVECDGVASVTTALRGYAEAWMKTSEADLMFRPAYKEFANKVLPGINDDVAKIGEKYGLKKSDLSLNLGPMTDLLLQHSEMKSLDSPLALFLLEKVAYLVYSWVPNALYRWVPDKVIDAATATMKATVNVGQWLSGERSAKAEDLSGGAVVQIRDQIANQVREMAEQARMHII